MTNSDHDQPLTDWELRAMRAVLEAGYDDQHEYGYWDELRSIGWVTSGRISTMLHSDSFLTRKTLRRLADLSYLDRVFKDHTEYFFVNYKGESTLNGVILNSRLLDSDKLISIKNILSQIIDRSETISENSTRAQMIGFVQIVETAISIPELPKIGLIAIIRDPAFVNVIQLGVFLAAIYAVLK